MAAPKEEKKEILVKVKIMKHVNHWVPGQVIEVSKEMAHQLCIVGKLHNGVKEVDHVRAMLLEDAEKLEAVEEKIENMTAMEADKKGIKNIVKGK